MYWTRLLVEGEDHISKFYRKRTNNVTHEFDPGDIVIVRRQVKTIASRGIVGKLQFKTKGPYRVIEKVNPNSCKVQRIPFTYENGGRPGRIKKESAVRMEKLSSTMVFHCKADGADTRYHLLPVGFRQNSDHASTPALTGQSEWHSTIRRTDDRHSRYKVSNHKKPPKPNTHNLPSKNTVIMRSIFFLRCAM